MECLVPSATPEFLNMHEIVRAGAGAGKTYALTHKVMDVAEAHLREHSRPPRMIVTTFTRKATQELRERLMRLALEEKPHLADFINSRSMLVVSTIHGVLDLYLKRYGGNIRVDPSYRVASAVEAGKIARQTLRGILFAHPEGGKLLESFSFNRLLSLVRKLDEVLGVRPASRPFDIAAYHELFSEKAQSLAHDLDQAAGAIRAESGKADWLAMADDYVALARMLKAGEWAKTRPAFRERLQALKTARRNAKAPPVSDETADEAERVREKARELLEPLYDPEVWKILVFSCEQVEKVGCAFSSAFRKAKRDEGLLEISDLELLAMECIREHPQTARSFWEEWDHWLIDEYQDTSPFQVEILRHLVGHRPCFIVGDPQQSIYLFRGARSEVFAEKEEEIVKGKGRRELLTVNRRSRPELLLFFNDFFGRMETSFQPMEPFLSGDRKIDPDRVVATIYQAPAIEEPAQSHPDERNVEAGDTAGAPRNQNEMRAIVRHIQDLLQSGVRPEDVCVLARTNRVLAEVAGWLSRYRIPTHVHVAAGFFDRREVRDALALLKFLVNPHDHFNLIELLRSPWFRVPDTVLAELTIRKPESLWRALVSERSAADEFEAVRRLQRHLDEVQVFGVSETFRRILVHSGFIDFSHAHDVSGRRESNIWKLLSRLQSEECKPGFNPLQFIASCLSDVKFDEGNSEGDAVAAVEPDRVNLMTVHASKGLEFKHVVLPRMEQRPRLTTNEEFTFDERKQKWAVRVPLGADKDMIGSLPEKTWLENFQKQELHEHARVLYVALTRAVESVFLSWSGEPARHSWAGMVRFDLTPGFHSEVSYTYRVLHGEIDPREITSSHEERIVPRAPWGVVTEPPGPFALPADPNAPKSLSVTQMLDRKEGRHFVSASNPDVVRRLTVASRGTAVHRLMELLKYPSAQGRTELLIAKWFSGQEKQVLDGVEFVRSLQTPPLAQIIRNGFVEYGFTMMIEGAVVEGQMDLWGRTDAGEAWIIDYKTGTPENREKAFEQMALYSLALRRSGQLTRDEPLRLAAVYPFAREVFIEDEPTAERIRRLFGFGDEVTEQVLQ